MKDLERDRADVALALKFDPKRFQSDYRVTRWEPGREVQFDKPLAWAAIALVVFCFLFMAVFLWAGSRVLADGLHPTSIGRFWKEETPFSQVVGLEMKRVHRTSRSNRGGGYARHFYWCELKARIRAEAGETVKPLLLVATDTRDDSDGPFRHLLPLATELATALGVNRDVTSSDR